jgi:MoxR-like ATPase
MTVPELAQALTNETEKIIVGKTRQIRLILTALLAEGHILLDDLPGVGKTTLVKTLAIATGCRSRRIQFVPDLMPSDIVGMNIYDQRLSDFRLLPGPVMTNILLADEINRAIPRTQSALLEAMEEKQVTIDGTSMPLPQPFIVMATQNPVESESTFQLPAAQMDRFLLRLSMGYPDRDEERRMLESLGDVIPFDCVETVASNADIVAAQKEIRAVRMAKPVADYLIDLVRRTRENTLIRLGASPRASRALYKAAKAWSAMQGRDFVTPDDVQELAVPVLAHRLLLSSEARLSRKSAEDLIREIVSSLPVPPAAEDIF